jgi:nicotinate-nucleotide adenylyltransferase
MLFVPASHPPHRTHGPAASNFHRFALVSLAIGARAHFRVSDAELRRSGPSYTLDTLHELHESGWPARQIFFIIGADAFADIVSWHGYPSVLDACHFVVISRAGTRLDASLMPPALRGRVRQPGENGPGTSICLVHAETAPVSSSEIRTRLAADQPIDQLVPPAVAHHIRRHHLYRTDSNLHGQN